MRQPKFEEFKAKIDGKAACIILGEAWRMKRDIEIKLAQNRIKQDIETKRILDFCFFLEDTLSLPAGLSEEDTGFYRRCVEKLISRGQLPPYVMDVFEGNSCAA
jgi:hypothetical protein